jgi:hypothetical protein
MILNPKIIQKEQDRKNLLLEIIKFMGLERFELHPRMACPGLSGGATTKLLLTQFLLGYIIILEIQIITAKTVMQPSDKDLPHLLRFFVSSSSSSF